MGRVRKARGDSKATRRAVVHYFREGFCSRFPSSLLLKWLFFWPNERESVFSQVGYSARAGKDFVEMVKKVTLKEVLTSDDESPAATTVTALDSNVGSEKACAEARAKVMWGETLSTVRAFLASKGISPSEIDTRVEELNAERNAEIRKIGIRNMVTGIAVLCGGIAILYPIFRYFDSLTQVNRPIFFGLFVVAGLYGIWKLGRGIVWVLCPQVEHRAVSDIAG